MKGDFTRDTFRRKKRYSGVRMQQGRVQTDADWNEQADITADRIETGTRHVVGRCGFPWHEPGFEIKAAGPSGLEIGAGFGYVDGILCWNPEPAAIDRQPDFPEKAPLVRVGGNWVAVADAPAGLYLAWLDVWTRHLTALDDPEIREVALGGPDTGTRARTVWQVRLAQTAAGTTCASNVPAWNDLVAPSTGKLKARAKPDQVSTDPCVVAPGAGYRRLENQLYRVEVHQGGALGTATFKWSRENGSVVTAWEKKDNDNLTVASAGRDAELGFAGGQWIELTDRDRDLLGETGTLVRLKSARGRVLEIDPATKIGPSVELADYKNQPRVRRWESQGVLKVEVPATNGGWIPLEDGVEVRFEAGTYRTGDYWYIPARTATGDVEWPRDGGQNPVAQLAQGILHHTCRLAMVTRQADGSWKIESDCRPLFPPLTDLISFYFRGGDGQEVNPDPLDRTRRIKLPETLVTAVTLGPYPLAGRPVRFTVTKGDGVLTGGVKILQVATGAGGLAACEWELDGNLASQEVKAELLGPDGDPMHTPVFFRATLSEASRVSYDPKDCPPLLAAQVRTVQEAIDELCKMDHGGGCEVTVGQEGQFATIEEALEALKDKDLCLCLLPGEHKLAAGLDITSADAKNPRHVAIHGCHQGARISATNKQIIAHQLASFALRNLEIEYNGVPDAIVLDDCGDVSVTSCNLFGEADGGALLTIGGATRIRLVDNDLRFVDRTSFERNRVLFAALPEIGDLFRAQRAGFSERRVASAAEALAARPRTERAAASRSLRAAFGNLGDTVAPEELEAARALAGALATNELTREAASTSLRGFVLAAAQSVPITALVLLDASADTTLEDNRIVGTVGLYGDPGRTAQTLTEEELRMAGVKKGGLVLGNPGRDLRLRGNRLTRIGIGQTVFSDGDKSIRKWLSPNSPFPSPDFPPLFRTLFLTDNVVERPGDVWLAHDVRMTTNSFDPINGDIGWTFGQSAFYTGNSAENDFRLFNAVLRPAGNVNNLNFLINIVFV